MALGLVRDHGSILLEDPEIADIIFDFELRGVSLSEIEEQLADEEFNEFLRVPPWAEDEG